MLKVILCNSLVNLQGLYGKPLKHDWVTRVVSPIQILLIFGHRCNRYFWDIWLEIDRLPNFNMLFQFMLTTFFKSELLSCLQKVLSCNQLMQKPYHYKKPLSNISDKCNKLGNFSIKTVQNLLVQNYNFSRSSLFFVHLYCQTRCLQTVGFPFTIFFRFEQMLMFHMCDSLENCTHQNMVSRVIPVGV